MKIIDCYIRTSTQNILDNQSEEVNAIQFWQNDFFRRIIMVLSPLSFIVVIPSLILSIKDGLYIIASFDALAFTFIQIILFSKSLSLKHRKLIFLFTIYLLGLMLLFYMGSSGPGFVYLLAVSAIATLVMSPKTGYFLLIINTLVLFVYAFLLSQDQIELIIELDLTSIALIVIGLNFIIFNIILLVSITSLMKGLQAKIDNERAILEQLRVESAKHKAAQIRAEESDRLKSAFLANISHEIRTPMNGIIGFSNLLAEFDWNEEERNAYIESINESSDRLLETINDLVEISKIDSDQLEIILSGVDLKSLLNSVCGQFDLLAKKKGISLRFHMENFPADLLCIGTDENKLRMVLSKLLSNSVKFTSSGTIDLICSLMKDKIEFVISDTGIGIHPTRLESIYDRFSQVDLNHVSGNEGLGLGLPIAKAYVKKLGGDIRLESVEGMGSSFSFSIPLEIRSVVGKDKGQIMGKGFTTSKSKIKILIVDDTKSSYLLLASILKSHKTEIIYAKNGQESIEFCKQFPDINLVLMDIKMPIMDGYEATRRIRKFRTDLPIIAQTAFAMAGDKELALESGCTDYISKPINVIELNEKVGKYINIKDTDKECLTYRSN